MLYDYKTLRQHQIYLSHVKGCLRSAKPIFGLLQSRQLTACPVRGRTIGHGTYSRELLPLVVFIADRLYTLLLQKIQVAMGMELVHVIFNFMPVRPSQGALIHQWLEQEHIKKWIHGKGLQNTLTGLEQFFLGKSTTTYWIGYDQEIPFAFLITSPDGNNAITLDLFICDLNYLGRGLAVSMIHQFLISQFPDVKKVLIDPEVANIRAIHVYKKAGFKIVGEFIASWHPVPHYQMELHMKDLTEKELK